MERIVLAYSGGLDTSVAIPWLAETYRAEVIAVTMDMGQGKELEEVRDRALATGGYTGLEPLVVMINKIDVTPPQALFQPAPKTAFDYKVTAAPPDARCAAAPMVPFPELRSAGGRMKR